MQDIQLSWVISQHMQRKKVKSQVRSAKKHTLRNRGKGQTRKGKRKSKPIRRQEKVSQKENFAKKKSLTI